MIASTAASEDGCAGLELGDVLPRTPELEEDFLGVLTVIPGSTQHTTGSRKHRSVTRRSRPPADVVRRGGGRRGDGGAGGRPGRRRAVRARRPGRAGGWWRW